MNATQIVHQTNLNKQADIIRAQQSSTLTVKDWCSQHQVSKDQFYYWKRKLKDKFVTKKGNCPICGFKGKRHVHTCYTRVMT